MSLMGHSRRFRALPRRSVLPPKAAVTADIAQLPKGATNGLMQCSKKHLVDHLVGARKQRLRYVKAERSSGLEINH